MTNSATDIYGNSLTGITTANIMTTGNTTHLGGAPAWSSGGGGGGYLSNVMSTAITHPATPMFGTAVPPMYTLAGWTGDLLAQPGMIDSVIQQLFTTVKPDEKIVVCVDQDMTWEQVTEIQEGLSKNKLSGIVIRGARAGTGFQGNYTPTPEEQRVDILARIGEIWEQRPDLKITDLLSWYDGQDMSDEEFATSVEVHFTKVTNGVHR